MRPEKRLPDKPKAACRRGVRSCFCLVRKHEARRWHTGGHAHGMYSCTLAAPLSNRLMLFAGGIRRVVWVPGEAGGLGTFGQATGGKSGLGSREDEYKGNQQPERVLSPGR